MSWQPFAILSREKDDGEGELNDDDDDEDDDEEGDNASIQEDTATDDENSYR